ERAPGKNALPGREILEVGCGGGLICEELAGRGASMVGVDPSQAALQTAGEHAQQSGLAGCITYNQGYAEALPYADASFSAIVCLDVLEHVRDLRATISEIARVLAPGGIFVFDTINRTLLARIALIWYGEHFPSGGLTPGIHEYRAFIKPAELRVVLEANQLKIHEMTGFMPRGFVQGRFRMGPGWFMGVSYVGYASK
ncbi:MAG: bifunctional 2-polyprenyl-6-hydroxyphenol methylase/3-demethylubiquinol 3-O-methyltransferase UbiG, partial [Ktedonobacteraceae bacterium]